MGPASAGLSRDPGGGALFSHAHVTFSSEFAAEEIAVAE